MINIERQPQTWTNDIGIPLVQNVIGGIVASALTSTLAAIIFNPPLSTVQSVALLTAVLVIGFSTIIRFFGDEIGLLKAAYREGQQSQQAEIQRLESMLYDATQQLDKLTAKPDIAIGGTMNNQQILDAVADAEKLIKWSFEGQAISRAACGRRGVKQRAWEKANKVLESAGIVADGHWMVDTPQAAMGQLQQHYERRSRQSMSANVITPY